MTETSGTILTHALKLLARRDYSVDSLRRKLHKRFGEVPDDVIKDLQARRFLDDRRYAENFASRRQDHGELRLRQELLSRGIDPGLIHSVVSAMDWPSLHEALEARMRHWSLRPPLQYRDAVRLFRALARLGYEEDAIREEIEQLHEQ